MAGGHRTLPHQNDGARPESTLPERARSDDRLAPALSDDGRGSSPSCPRAGRRRGPAGDHDLVLPQMIGRVLAIAVALLPACSSGSAGTGDWGADSSALDAATTGDAATTDDGAADAPPAAPAQPASRCRLADMTDPVLLCAQKS